MCEALCSSPSHHLSIPWQETGTVIPLLFLSLLSLWKKKEKLVVKEQVRRSEVFTDLLCELSSQDLVKNGYKGTPVVPALQVFLLFVDIFIFM